MFLFSILKDSKIGLSDAALVSLVSIIIVFLVLLIIIGITELVFKLTGLFDLKKELDNNKNIKSDSNIIEKNTVIKDDDMMAAVLVASIDYQNEIKKDVRLVSVTEVKK